MLQNPNPGSLLPSQEPKNPTPALGPSSLVSIYESQSLTHYWVGNPINDKFQM